MALWKQGFVTDKMADLDYSYFYTCGPEAMLKAVYEASNTSGQFSLKKEWAVVLEHVWAVLQNNYRF